MNGDNIVRQIREMYDGDGLVEPNVSADPIVQFETWISEAISAQVPEPNAMTLATVNRSGAPSARIVLLRGFGPNGFVFYTNYESRKGHEIAANSNAALVFFWAALHRQVRIEGTVAKVSSAISDEYFATRPRGHRLSAWASRQSSVLPNRRALEAAFLEAEQKFEGADVPRPPYWGGYSLVPATIEFWQGRPNRTHDRFSFERTGPTWHHSRLSP